MNGKEDRLMKKFIKTGIALTAAAMVMSGCGEGLMVMNEKEEAIVVSYSAGALAKRNRYQPEGLTAVYQGEEEDSAEEEPKKPAEAKAPEEEDAADTKAPEEEGAAELEAPDSEGAQGANALEGEGGQEASASLTDALGIEGIQFSYQDYFVSDTYQQGDYYILNAGQGNAFVILNFNITNGTAGEAPCDILSRKPIFTLDVGEGSGVRNEVTMLENDLSTYKGSIGPGQTETAVLLFKVPQDKAEALSDIGLSLLVDGAANSVAIE